MNAQKTERLDFLADELFHPVEFFLEIGIGFEIPSHLSLSMSAQFSALWNEAYLFFRPAQGTPLYETTNLPE